MIGRQGDSDIVIEHPSVSRRHALIQLTADGAVAIALGRTALEINGKKCERMQALSHGDRLTLPDAELQIELEAERPSANARGRYRLRIEGGSSFGLAHSPFVIGGDPADDLIIKKWPAHALRLHLAQDELYAEAMVAKVLKNDVAMEKGAMEPLLFGDRLTHRRERLIIEAETASDATTTVGPAGYLPQRVHIEMLPRGGRVVFTLADGVRAVYLADRRLDLLIALLQPPDGFSPGDFIPDDVVRAVVWPRNPAVTRPEINMLISRCRRDLVEAGLAGGRLLERSPGGGGTRLALAPDAQVTLQS
ncbi:MAG: FHA domain-containing protein [Kofleriaceae bacterium]